MCIRLILVICSAISVLNTYAQSNLDGYYIRKSHKFDEPSLAILKFEGNKFYSYFFTQDVAGTLVFRIGEYSVNGTSLTVLPDTTISISLNTGTIKWVSLNCDTATVMKIIGDHRIIAPHAKYSSPADKPKLEHYYMALEKTSNIAQAIEPRIIDFEKLKMYNKSTLDPLKMTDCKH